MAYKNHLIPLIAFLLQKNIIIFLYNIGKLKIEFLVI